MTAGTRGALVPTVMGLLALALGGCSGGIVANQQTEGTAAGYQVVADAAESILADARGALPEGSVTKEEVLVTDLETDRHRLTCSDSTSQYRNIMHVWLADGVDGAELVESMTTDYLAAGWQSDDQPAGSDEKDADAASIQTLRNPDGYGLSIDRGEDTDGATIIGLRVYSPCVPNPADKPRTWGLR